MSEDKSPQAIVHLSQSGNTDSAFMIQGHRPRVSYRYNGFCQQIRVSKLCFGYNESADVF